MNKPNLSYSYFEYGVMSASGTPTTVILNQLPTEPIKVSFQNGFNQLVLKYTPNMQLTYYEVRITKIDEEYGIGTGTLWYSDGPNVSGNDLHTVTLNVNSTYFTDDPPDGSYRISINAKGVNGIWDVTYLFLTTEADETHLAFAPSGYDGLEVLTDEPIPSV